jgi:predicted hydrolase (HD superfamily)
MADETGFGRAAALRLLEEHTHGASLRKHAQAVAVCMEAWGARHAAGLGLGAAEAAAMAERYAATGLLHDLDYEQHPSESEHPYVCVRLLETLGWPEEVRTAILGHAAYTGVARTTHLAQALFACDELSGLLTACALVKPSRAIADVELAGVRKKMKDRAFARGVNREDIEQGARELGVSVDEQISFCLQAMQRRAGELGLAGQG